MANIFTDNITLWVSTISSLITGGVTYIFSSNKRKSEEKQTESTALQSMQVTYDGFVKDFNDKFDELKQELKEVKIENREQRSTLRELQKDNSKMHREIAELTKENLKLQNIVKELKMENEKLRNKLNLYQNKRNEANK